MRLNRPVGTIYVYHSSTSGSFGDAGAAGVNEFRASVRQTRWHFCGFAVIRPAVGPRQRATLEGFGSHDLH
jgi:hypothetical protein